MQGADAVTDGGGRERQGAAGLPVDVRRYRGLATANVSAVVIPVLQSPQASVSMPPPRGHKSASVAPRVCSIRPVAQ
jgi:hypothetical protein